MAGLGKRTLLRDVNPHLICKLCRGYLIDAVTVVECLHSFCRSCILKHLSTVAHCPSCKHALNKAKPNIKADKTLQDIVYKLVPGLYHKEMLKRREFYKKHPEHANSATPEQRGEDVSGRLIFNPEDVVSLSLEYLPPGVDPLTILITNDMDTNNLNANNSNNNNSNSNNTVSNKRYLQCPALVTIAHLKKFIAMKYSVDITRYTIEICHRRAPLPENWTLMDVAYIYAWKRIAPIRFFYRVAQEEQRLEAPLHQRPSTPGLGACLPPNDVPDGDNNVRDDNNSINHLKIFESEPNEQVDQTVGIGKTTANDSNETPPAKDLNKTANDKHVETLVECKQATTTEKDETNKTTVRTIVSTTSSTSTASTVSTATTATTTMLTTTAATNASSSSSMVSASNSSTATTCNDSSMQIKSPIKILKNPDGKYEVLKSPSSIDRNEKDQTTTDIKSSTSPEFSVVNSNGVKITLKQCSPPQNNNTKKPKVISNVLLRCSQVEKDTSSSSSLSSSFSPPLTLHLQQQDKLVAPSPLSSPDKQEKQRRKVTFVDQLPNSEKLTSLPNANANANNAVLKTALKKPAEQQDKKQFLQSIQLTAREPVVSDHDGKLKSPGRNICVPANDVRSLQKSNLAMPKMDEILKKDGNEVKENSSTENARSNANAITTNTISKRMTGMSAGNRMYTGKMDDTNGRTSFNSGTDMNSMNIMSNNHKMDVYTFSSDPPIVPAGAVKRKCPPGVPIADLKRRKSSQISQKEVNKKQQTVSSQNTAVKLSRTPSAEHVIPMSRTTNVAGDHGGIANRMSNVTNNVKSSTGPILSSDTRNLLDGCGLSIPASLSITLTSPKSGGTSGQFVESNELNDNNRVKVALGKVNPSITLNDRSVDPRVLKALKTGQIRMPVTPAKIKPATAMVTTAKQTTTDRSEMANRMTPISNKQKKESQEQPSKDILDLSGGNKKMDMHPLRIPQPVPKLNRTNKRAARDDTQSGGISEQGQIVTLMSGHKYYRAPPGSLTPAAHRVNDCPLPTPSRTPVYAPSLSSVNRSNTNLSSVFPSLQSLYALSQAPNLQQFQMDTARLRLPPRSTTENSAVGSVPGTTENTNPSISMPGKSHLAAQCMPIKPTRSSVAPLVVPINKQQSTDKLASANVNKAAHVSNVNKLPIFHNNESLDSTNETSKATTVPKKLSNVESTNNRLVSRSNNDNAKSNVPTAAIEIAKDSNAESKNESVDTDSSLQQQQQQQHREAASPRVSSTASPSPPPGGNGSVNTRNENSINHSDNINSNDTNASNKVTNATSSTTKNNVVSEITCNKSPVSPDSSSITVENSGTNKNCSTSTDQEIATDAQVSSDVIKSSDSTANPDDSTVDDSTISDDGNKLVNKSEATEMSKQLTSEMVQKRLLAVFPSNEWAHNPIAAEHLGNFLKSLNATIKSEGHAEESNKTESSDPKKIIGNDGTRTSNDASVNSKNDIVERS